ncbi:uncharacterized protein PFLUO_LOCUS2833 [Penicillium psychrofluorescens]|uniref:uncharacterized protein n=1 Tax=Penicillium psychrofluorescens TaxID=3158075 RepID=UPI003CCE09AF
MSSLLSKLRGGNLEVFKFGVYIMFPIGWMYYFGTNLDDRFNVKGFWPTAEQSHKIPLDKEEIDQELSRMRGVDAMRSELRKQREVAEEQARARAEAQAQAASQSGQ